MRRGLNDLAQRLDKRATDLELLDSLAVAPESSGSGLIECVRRILDVIEGLQENDREVLSLIRLQGMPHVEAAQIVSVSVKTIQQRLNRGLLSLTLSLSEFHFGEEDA